jgi:hypothetical protein
MKDLKITHDELNALEPFHGCNETKSGFYRMNQLNAK